MSLTSRLVALALALAAWAPPSLAEAGVRMATAQEFVQVLAAEQGKVVVLNLWATWCTPCLKEIPDLVELERELAARGVKLVAVGMDAPEERDRVEAFRKEHFPEFRSYLRNELEMDTLVSVVDPAWNELLPTTYLIDRDGKVAKRIQGKRSLEAFRTEVAALLD